MPLSPEQQRIQEMQRIIRDPSFAASDPNQQVQTFARHLASTDPSIASFGEVEQRKIAAKVIAEHRPGFLEKVGDVAEIIPIVGEGIQGFRSASAGLPSRKVTSALTGGASDTEDPYARAGIEALRGAVEFVGTGLGSLALVKGGVRHFGSSIAEKVGMGLAETGAEAATTIAAQAGKQAATRRLYEDVAINATQGVMLGAIQAMERGEVKPFEDFVLTPMGAGVLGLGFYGLGRAATKFGEHRTRRVLQTIEGLNDEGFAKFINTDGPMVVNAIKKTAGLQTEAAASLAEKASLEPLTGTEGKLIRSILMKNPEILKTEVGQHILRMQRDQVLSTKADITKGPFKVHYEPLVDEPSLGFKKRWDKIESEPTPERMAALAAAHKDGKIHVRAIEGKVEDVLQFGEVVQDLAGAKAGGIPALWLNPGRTPGGKPVWLSNVKPNIEDIPNTVPDFFTTPEGITTAAGGVPIVRPRMPEPGDMEGYAEMLQRIMLEADGVSGRTADDVVEGINRLPPAPRGRPGTSSPRARLEQAQREVDDLLEGMAFSHAYLDAGEGAKIGPETVVPPPFQGRSTQQIAKGNLTVFDIGTKTDIDTNTPPRAPITSEVVRPISGTSEALPSTVTPAMSSVVTRYKTKGPPKGFSPQLYQALKDANIDDAKISAARKSGDVKGLLDELVSVVDGAKAQVARSEAIGLAEQTAMNWDVDSTLARMGLNRSDYNRMIVERAGYTLDDTGRVVSSAEIAMNPQLIIMPSLADSMERAARMQQPRPIKGLLGTDIAYVGPLGNVDVFIPASRGPKGRFTAAQDLVAPDELEFIVRSKPYPYVMRHSLPRPGQTVKLRMGGEQRMKPGDTIPARAGDTKGISPGGKRVGVTEAERPVTIGYANRTIGEENFFETEGTITSVDLGRAVTVEYTTESGERVSVKALMNEKGDLKVAKALLKHHKRVSDRMRKELGFKIATERNIMPGQEIYIMDRMGDPIEEMRYTNEMRKAGKEPDPAVIARLRAPRPDFVYRITRSDGERVTIVGEMSNEPIELPLVNILSAMDDGDVRLAEWVHPADRATLQSSELGIKTSQGSDVKNVTELADLAAERETAVRRYLGQQEELGLPPDPRVVRELKSPKAGDLDYLTGSAEIQSEYAYASGGRVGTTTRGNKHGDFDDFVGMMESELDTNFVSDIRDLAKTPALDPSGKQRVRKIQSAIWNKETGELLPHTVEVPLHTWKIDEGGQYAQGHAAYKSRRRMAMGMLHRMDERIAIRTEMLEREIAQLPPIAADDAKGMQRAYDAAVENQKAGKKTSRRCPPKS